MTIQPINIRKFVEKMLTAQGGTAENLNKLTQIAHETGAMNVGVSVFGQMIDEANRLDAYAYVLRGFDIGDARYGRALPDGYTVATAPFDVLMTAAEEVLRGLQQDMIHQARRPHTRNDHDRNPEYFYTLGDILHKLETAINDDRYVQRRAEQEANLAEQEG